MENCLVTKLNGLVANNNLEELGVISFTLPANSTAVIGLQSSEANGLILDIVGGEVQSASGDVVETPQFIPSGYVQKRLLVAGNNGATVKLGNKYKIKKLFTTGDSTHNPGKLTTLNINTLKYSEIIDLAGDNYVSIKLNGNIKDAAEWTNIANVTNLNIRESEVTGKWEDFVAIVVNRGITSKSIAISNNFNGSITFKGSASTSGTGISWQRNSINTDYIDITIGTNKTTINVQNDGTWSYVNNDMSPLTN